MLRSTTIIGGSSAINVVFSIVQAKVAALIVGPAGVGMIGLFRTATGVAAAAAGMGLSTTAVRDIAEAAAGDDPDRIARTVRTLRRTALFFGVIGALLFFALRRQIASVTFGDETHAAAMGWLAVVPLAAVVAGGQAALIRGMRRIGDLARVSVFGAALGTVLGLPMLYVWRERGIAPHLATVAGASLLVSWLYARRIRVSRAAVNIRETVARARGMVLLGVVFMLAGLANAATLYLVKVLVTRDLGLPAAGLYEASSSFANVYVGFILGAMGADFFPHLASVSDDDALSTRLINAQVEIGLLIATPGILAVVALGPYVLTLLYSSKFVDAYEILRWQALGTFLRVVTWPIGFLFLARGRKGYFLCAQIFGDVVHLGLVTLGLWLLGLRGIGPAFAAMYCLHVFFVTALANRLVGFRWSPGNLRLLSLLLPVVVAGLAISYPLGTRWNAIVGLLIACLVGILCLRRLYNLVGAERVRTALQNVRARFVRRGP